MASMMLDPVGWVLPLLPLTYVVVFVVVYRAYMSANKHRLDEHLEDLFHPSVRDTLYESETPLEEAGFEARPIVKYDTTPLRDDDKDIEATAMAENSV
mmetsp:Transcript_22784/g.53998  ORF Transcript_22784/g.53998 Transcript_22784/m.53998 type:complete len:98 (-) Transcript_22784:245-538(-)|eukprot:CAMPEP_0197186358 /NCGR_PEP_ID=MMETSP1423-20130617/13771_1 /TAXON_ID=476441 /ORGANISM="Pseudo-nitzschia heimii, Strain UNC1101" /LENGTH=97 /DNA_ID=CAMNT_0042637647 /DNA_START=139 /DNA_END=432 /DNA_ORIENTATION=-